MKNTTLFTAFRSKLIFSLFFILGLFLFVPSNAQIIATFAGNGTAGYSGDGGQATAAELHTPGGLLYDSYGNLYIADAGNNRVRIVSQSDVINTYAGDGTAGYSGDGGAATAAEINTPKGLAEDASGNIYIADEANNRIRKVNTSGVISTFAGTGTAGYSGDGGAATSAKLHSPYGIAVDASGNLYIADEANERIRVVNTSGVISTFAGDGTAGYSGDGGAATSAELNHPINVEVDASGNIYIADYLNNRIRKVNTSGTISTFAGDGTAGFSGDGGAATAAEIYMSTGAVKIDGYGNLYIADDGNNRVRVVNSSGIINTVAGTGTAGFAGDGGQATAAELDEPTIIGFDSYGNYYIADAVNERIRVVYLSLDVTTTVTANVSCNGGSNGSASVTVSHGTTPYTYSWSGGGTNSTYTGLTAGTYTVTVTDNDGITGSVTATITQPTALSVSTTESSSSMCPSSSDSLFSSVSGGISPYTYSWSPSSGLSCTTCQKMNAKPSGTATYTLTVTDNNGCTATSSERVLVSCVGDSCNNTFIRYVDSTMSNVSLADSVDWFKFTATSKFVNVVVDDPSDTLNGRIDSITLYSGSCSSLNLLTGGTYFSGGEDSVISIGDTGLIIGNVYYIKTTKSIAGTNDEARFFSIYVLSNPLNPNVLVSPTLTSQIKSIAQDWSNNCVASTCGDYVSNGNFEVLNQSTSVMNSNGYGLMLQYPWRATSGNSDVSCWWGTNVTGDYFNSCILNSSCIARDGVPKNGGCCPNYSVPDHSTFYGWAGPNYGYADIIADYDGWLLNNVAQWPRAYLLEPLLNPLTNGVTYKVSFWVQLAPNSDGSINAADLGLLFTNTGSNSNSGGSSPLLNVNAYWDQIDPVTGNPAIPQITGVSTPLCPTCTVTPTFNSTNTWVNITGQYTANGTEQFIEIGNFNETNAHNSGSGSLPNQEISYYVDDVSILPIPPAPVISGVQEACGSGPFTYTCNSVTGISYTWSCPDATPSSGSGTTATITSFSSLPATITWTATYTNNVGCPSNPSSSSTFTVDPCCATGTYDLVINTENASEISGGSILSGESILINGVLTIDQLTSFDDCDVQFTPGSEIDILNGQDLYLEGDCDHLYASPSCDAMWQGIVIEPGGYLFAGYKTLIEDAKTAIYANNSKSTQASFSLDDNVVINKCWQGILIGPTSNPFYSDALACVFTCRDLSSLVSSCSWSPYANWDAQPLTTLISPHSGVRSHIGIITNNVKEYSDFINCYFDNLDYGVYSNQSNIGVFGNYFQNITRISGNETGVYATGTSIGGNTLTVGGPLYYQPNEFHDCNIGVWANFNMDNVSILDNEFINSSAPAHFAIGVRGSVGSHGSPNSINISYDTITNATVGIWSEFNQNISAKINNNLINNGECGTAPYYGISLNEGLGDGTIYSVNNNKIYSLNYGIYGNYLKNATIYNNTVTLGGVSPCSPSLSESYGRGIWFAGCTNSRIADNTVTAPYQIYYSGNWYSVYYDGIYEEKNTSLSIRCNTINDAAYQIHPDILPSTGNEIYTNSLNAGGTGNIGMKFTNSAFNRQFLGSPTLNAGNTWNNSFSCRSEYSGTYGVPTYYYPTGSLGCSYNTYPNCGSCSLALNAPPASLLDSSCPAPPIIVHSAQYIVIDSLSMDTLTSDSIPAAFNIAPDSTTIAFMDSVALGNDSLNMIGDTNIIFNKEGILSVLWQNQSLLSSDTILRDFNDSISSTSLGKIWRIDSSITYVNMGGSLGGPANPYSVLLDSLDNITPSSNIETNLKTALSGYLNLQLNDSLSASQLGSLQTLATLCPKNDGEGVYMARAIVALFDTVQPTYYDSVCGTGNQPHRPVKRKDTTQSAPNDVGFNLYPNPNNGNFTIEYQLEQGATGKVCIFNTVGEKVGEYMLNQSEGKMYITNYNLSNGVYIYQLYENNNVIKFGKIIIMK